MQTVNMHEAKTHLSKLVDRASRGESFIIARAGKPLVRVVPIDSAEETAPLPRLGFMAGEFEMPDDIKAGFEEEVEAMFYGGRD